jgi:hypothetical protein
MMWKEFDKHLVGVVTWTRTDSQSICIDCKFKPIFGPICPIARQTVPATSCSEYKRNDEDDNSL